MNLIILGRPHDDHKYYDYSSLRTGRTLPYSHQFDRLLVGFLLSSSCAIFSVAFQDVALLKCYSGYKEPQCSTLASITLVHFRFY